MSAKPTLKDVLKVFQHHAIKTRHEVLPNSFRHPEAWKAEKDKAYAELKDDLRALNAHGGIDLTDGEER